MTGLRMTSGSSFGRRGRKSRGFTLVELIVILIIVAILAAAGVATALGYIKKTKFDKNNQTAITVYQTAQTALSNKMANGTIQRWILDFPGFDASDVDFTSDSETNFSQHKTVSLTYNHKTSGGAQDKYLYDFLSPYLYYPTIFGGTLSVEFDICITKDNGHLSYTANVLSAFFSSENDSESGGWDVTCLGGSTDGLPNRSESYRRSTSLVGYYSGSDSDDNVVSAVTIPWDSDHELEGHVVGPVDGERQAKGYLFNLRNAETLDVSWAIFDDDRDPEREDDESYTYQYTLRADHDERLFIYIYDVDADEQNKFEILVTPEALDNVEYGDVYTTYEVIDGNDITRQSATGFITLTVIRGSYVDAYVDGTTPDATKCRTYTFPITRTLVTGDPRTGVPVAKEVGYYEYSLALDSIRVRSATAYDDTKSGSYQNYYGSARLFGDTTPRNICAKLGSSSTWSYTNKEGDNQYKTDLFMTYAARAINDPVYFEGAGMRDGQLKYCYQVREHCGRFDGEDDTTTYDEYIITGRGVVNTCFGDKVYANVKDPSDKPIYIGGTSWDVDDRSAVLTNCRHLYNIGILTSNDLVTYRVVSDINWYYHETYKDGEETNDKYASEVRVFTKDKFNSPVASDGSLRVVSFPAINCLKSNATLTSISDLNRRVYSINNFQLRQASYINNTDLGFGIICKNEGTIYNLYANNISNIFESVADGSPSDYSKINANSAVEATEKNVSGYTKQPFGSLIGYNKGTIGSSTETADNKNTVRVSNSIVMSGGYWQYNTNFTDVGGVMGKNSERSAGVVSTYGVIEVCGSFAVVGVKSTGGIIGFNESSLGARLVVDGSDVGKSEFDLPAIKVAGTEYVCSCAVISKARAGGAIGYFDGGDKANRYFTGVANKYSMTGNEFDTLDDTDFNIVVDLPSDGLIVNLVGNENDATSAGAIACLYNAAGDYLAIRTNISGKIITGYTGTGYSHTGGAIGKEFGKAGGDTNNSVVKEIYLDCTNNAGSVIGAVNSSVGATCTGGAIGRFDSYPTKNINRKVAINVVNYGAIRARGDGEGTGAGGAVGGSTRCNVPFIIRVFNGSGSEITGYGDKVGNTNGTGGAIGGMAENGNDNCKLPLGTWVYVVNYGTISGPHRVGGAIGSSPTNSGSVYAENHGTITGGYFVGGAVGCNPKNQYGMVTTVLNGATITGDSYVGGSIGRCLNFRNSGTIETYVYGSSTVTGTGYLVGGVGGDISVADQGSTAAINLIGASTNPTLTVTGGLDGVGGAVGLLRSQNTHSVEITVSSQTDLDRLAVVVEGENDVGGVIGRLLSASNSNYGNINPMDFYKNTSNKNIELKLDVYLNPRTSVTGHGANVGGAIGNIRTAGGRFTGYINVISRFAAGDGAILISGTNNVGGAVGLFESPIPYNDGSESGVFVDFTAYPVNVTATVSGEASDANAGGAVGYLVADTAISNNTHFVMKAYLGDSKIISEGSNVGGVVGNNNGSLLSTDITVTLDSAGVIQGGGKVGGAIGKNFAKKNNGIMNSVTATILGYVTGTGTGVGPSVGSGKWSERRTDIGTGDCIGGAIGYNHAFIESVNTTVEGTITGDADSVGGAIGYCHSNAASYWVLNIKTNLQGNAEIKGIYNVGGSVGKNICNIYNIETTIIGTAHIIGEMRIGGSVGFASANPNIGGDTVRDGGSWGRIDKIKTTISADYALSGDSRIGGCVGQQGDKWGSGASYTSAALLKIEAEINTAYLFDADDTGPDDIEDSACVGGVFGIFVDGRVGGKYKEFATQSNGSWSTTGKSLTGEGAVLSGTGGLVRLDYPNQSYTHAVLISAKGRSVGGIVGQIGANPKNKNETWLEQNVCMSEIKVADGGPNICVVSVNGADMIGGWIGSGYAAHGGIGADKTDDPMVTYNVNTVKAVFSRGDYVGGFCGYSSGFNNNNTARNYTHAHINVILDNASVIGRTSVGGVFGGAVCCKFEQGSINVSLINRTNVGDLVGNEMPGDDTDYDAICYDAGGVFGSVANVDLWDNSKTSVVNEEVNVTVDGSSRICGYGEENADILKASDAGVGGVFGRCEANVSNVGTPPSVRVICTDPENIAKVNTTETADSDVSTSVYSKYSNAGGIIGVMNKGTVKNCSALISVRGDAAGACVGGVVGKMGAGTIEICHYGMDKDYNPVANTTIKDYNYFVASAGESAYTGGFVGFAGAGITIKTSYTTATVKALAGTATGGFAGQANTGTIESNYVGGHTYSGQYLYNSGDVTGGGKVGGFIGQTTGNVSIKTSYTTASVSGSGTYAGGFIGSRADGTSINTCYSTGLVIASAETVAGAFAGSSVATNYTSTYVLRGVNKDKKLVGTLDAESIKGLSFTDSATINGGKDYTGHPFDASLGETYPLRAVIGNEHWGDWPTGVTGEKSILETDIHLNKEIFDYDKDGVTVESELQLYSDELGRDLILDEEYTLTYTNNDRVGKAQVMIMGKGVYSGAISLPFTIVEKSIKDATVEIEKAGDPPKAVYEYTGAPIVPVITVKVGDDELVLNTDYYLTYNPDNTNICEDDKEITVTVHGIGNYKDIADMTDTFQIIGRNIGDATVDYTNSFVYTGSAIEPDVTVRIDGRTLTRQTDTETGDYRVEYSNNIHAGDSAIIKIVPTNPEYGGEKYVTFKITTATNAVTAEPAINGWTWKEEPSSLSAEMQTKFGTHVYSVYSDEACTDNCLVDKVSPADLSEAMRNLDAGTYYLYAEVEKSDEHPDDYTTVSSKVPFTVTPADFTGEVEVTLAYDIIAYNGTAREPSVTVTYKGKELPDTNYSVAYANNVEPGDATVTITGKGNCVGTATAQFTINPMYTVTFYPNGEGASLNSDATVYVEKGYSISEPAEPSWDGYRFDGWYQNEQCIGDAYVFGSSVNEDTNLYAKWVKQLTITYVLYDDVKNEVEMDYNAELTRPADPIRAGYEFAGWYSDPEGAGENHWNFGLSAQGDYFIYAHWTEMPDVKVTFNTNGGTTETFEQDVKYNGLATVPEIPVYEGHNFEGWYKDPECTDSFDFDMPVAADVMLYAKWSEVEDQG